MAIRQDIIGTHYRYPDYFEVGREKMREFAAAIKDDCEENSGVVAPVTFLAVAGRRVQLKIFTEMDLPINLARVLHRDQKLKFHRPIKAGDRLYFDSYLDNVLESHGMVTAEVRAEVTDAHGEPVATSIVTMIGEAQGHENSDSVTANIASHRKD
ncbi:MaoC family dehydratase N-terminal domain-containing protein [Mycobacterium sp. NPDC050853]|uniref:FAS1-like dehydratase domain-containing protein n=1 Tax=Mycobacteriaceae TaxID=1762 RepID=UPI0015E058D7|nr:MaoC family dehydratase N-terminal domain-containing protein [Mycobacteroides sp. LB1]